MTRENVESYFADVFNRPKLCRRRCQFCGSLTREVSKFDFPAIKRVFVSCNTCMKLEYVSEKLREIREELRVAVNPAYRPQPARKIATSKRSTPAP